MLTATNDSEASYQLGQALLDDLDKALAADSAKRAARGVSNPKGRWVVWKTDSDRPVRVRMNKKTARAVAKKLSKLPRDPGAKVFIANLVEEF